MTFTIGFAGGAGTVTGSKYLLTAGDSRVLIDCGMFQGIKRLRLQNWEPPPFEATEPAAILLTHAHLDHAGYLPRLVAQGYRGPVYCTPATAEMTRILLLDAAEIQEEDAAFANREGFSRHKPALPLYTVADALKAISLIRTVDYRRPFEPAPGITAEFHNAGHILGSSFIQFDVHQQGGGARIVFSGDLGRYHQPLHTDPDPLPACDALVLESTYGNELHDDEPLATQVKVLFAEAIAQKGTILIPAFAVARAQLITLVLQGLIESGRLPAIPIHVDSPMASDVTAVYNRFLESEYLDRDIPHTTPKSLFPRNVTFHRTVQESKRLNNLPGPRIIIAASGMLTGGRVLHHLMRLAPDRRNLIVLAGYQAAGTRGRALLEGAQSIRMYGRDIPIFARVVSLKGLSAHADRDELLRWVGTAPTKPRAIFLTHGEPDEAVAFATHIEGALGVKPVIPNLNDEFDLSSLLH